jgi:hypothetical protein
VHQRLVVIAGKYSRLASLEAPVDRLEGMRITWQKIAINLATLRLSPVVTVKKVSHEAPNV